MKTEREIQWDLEMEILRLEQDAIYTIYAAEKRAAAEKKEIELIIAQFQAQQLLDMI